MSTYSEQKAISIIMETTVFILYGLEVQVESPVDGAGIKCVVIEQPGYKIANRSAQNITRVKYSDEQREF